MSRVAIEKLNTTTTRYVVRQSPNTAMRLAIYVVIGAILFSRLRSYDAAPLLTLFLLLLFYLNRRHSVCEESLTAIAGVGLQLCRRYATGRETSEFIELAALAHLILPEHIGLFSCHYYLACLLHRCEEVKDNSRNGAASSSISRSRRERREAAAAASSASGGPNGCMQPGGNKPFQQFEQRLVVPFHHLQPPLVDLEAVYNGARAVLWREVPPPPARTSSSSSTTGAAAEEAASSSAASVDPSKADVMKFINEMAKEQRRIDQEAAAADPAVRASSGELRSESRWVPSTSE